MSSTMRSRHISRTRIPSSHPLRPPNTTTLRTSQARPLIQLTHRFCLSLSHRPITRPQLPYLVQPSLRPTGSFLGPNPHLARLISTETRSYISEQVYLAVKWTAIIWVFGILGGIAYLGLIIELQERANPTPEEWSFWSRWALRGARGQISAGETSGFVDWASAGASLRRCLARLEDRTRDGKGLRDVEEGGILIEGVGRAGLDISAQSWPWRSGYFEVIMGCAAAAEQMDSMVLDESRGLVFPREMVIGPSNPDPRPIPSYMPTAPLEENCVRPCEVPEIFYLRVLTATGFTTRQKLDAALAYANWLEFKGLQDSAEEMYKWGIDIAKAGLPNNTKMNSFIDPKTNVLKAETSTATTSNLLHATTALAVHHARTNNLASALPILLSVLRARRSAPESIVPPTQHFPTLTQPQTDISAATNFLSNLFTPASKYPPPPPSGDLPVTRESSKPTCEESELMLYIGEILFATSYAKSASQEGLGWTRQAVTVAEANLQTYIAEPKDREKCKACLATGVGNWETMLQRLAEQESASATREGGRDAGWFEWRGWFSQDGGAKGKAIEELSTGMIGEELRRVGELKERIAREGTVGDMAKVRGAPGGGGTGLWVGG
ncbi:hypothetical protein LTR62_006910 [Meristemomyces frigidus]|uniref:MFS maltose permease n=1 Tax=Meristemomyces frigidus TaxID=1508187 RepID=A0AAN7YMN0_9PEZI|nr:hypothetical protein LTR62_006910 [Meristemomyces frigidus]